MKAIQSVWFNYNLGNIDYNCGWISPVFHIMSWALSFSKLHKYFPHVDLITDNFGIEIAEKIGLRYSSISIDLEENKNKDFLWVLNKIHTYSIQEEPFIHLDTDAYFFNSIASDLLAAPLVAQNYEYNHPYYVDFIQQVTKFSHIPQYLKDIDLRHISAVNAGIIGGNNIGFFKHFEAEVIALLVL